MYKIKRLWLNRDKKAKLQWEQLMGSAGLHTKEEIDYTVGIYNGSKLIATGSYAHNVIKSIAVCKDYQSENFLTKLVVHLMQRLQEEGLQHYFVYTKPESSIYFNALGFKEIIQTTDVTFMEFGEPEFDAYLSFLKEHQKEGNNGSVVINANPFTKGHRYLIEKAVRKSDYVYVFVLSEDRSEFTTNDRLEMVKRGTSDLKNVIVLPTNDYMVSSATFPSYFLRENAHEDIARVQAIVDATLFKDKIAQVLNIVYRFVGEEPYSAVTEIYNKSMVSVFQNELELTIVPRKKINDETISATKVRKWLSEEKFEEVKKFVPNTTYEYIKELNN